MDTSFTSLAIGISPKNSPAKRIYGTTSGTLILAILSVSKHNCIRTLMDSLSVSSPTAGLSITAAAKPKKFHCPRWLPPSPIGEITLQSHDSPAPRPRWRNLPQSQKPCRCQWRLGGQRLGLGASRQQDSVKLRRTPTAMVSVNILDLVFVAQQFIE